MADLSDIAAQTIENYKMISPGDRILAAVSGGPDSTALLSILWGIAKNADISLHVWHLNHLIRAEAAGEAEKVAGFAAKLGLSATVSDFDVKGYAKEHRLSVQESGRIIRYRLLRAACKSLGMNKIAVGHNADDSVETLLINLIRGTGTAGLGGIPPVAGQIIRPLIEAERNDIVSYLDSRGLEYVVDLSNTDKRYFRNRLRLEVVPALKAVSPVFTRQAMRAMSIVRDDEGLLSDVVDKAFAECALIGKGEAALDVAMMTEMSSALRRRLVRRAISVVSGHLKNMNAKSIDAVIEKTLLHGESTQLPQGVRVAMDKGKLIFFIDRGGFESARIGDAGGVVEIDPGSVSVTITQSHDPAWPPEPGLLVADADAIVWPLEIRMRRRGDRFKPLGMLGHKKIQDFSVDSKIPKYRRAMVPVLSDSRGIIAVGYLRIDERVRVTKRTKTFAILRSPTFLW